MKRKEKKMKKKKKKKTKEKKKVNKRKERKMRKQKIGGRVKKGERKWMEKQLDSNLGFWIQDPGSRTWRLKNLS